MRGVVSLIALWTGCAGVPAADTAASGNDDGPEVGTDADPTDTDTSGDCLLYTSPSPRDGLLSRMPSSA